MKWDDEPGWIFADPAAYADFDGWHEIATRLRRTTPVYRVELPDREPFWALTRHADVMQVERDPETFHNFPAPTLMPKRPASDAEAPPVKTLVQLDGEEHRVHRALTSAWFKPGNIRKLTGDVEALAKRSVDEMAKTDSCDFARDIANYFPLRVILSILGLPEDDFPRMLQLTQELFGADDPDFERIAADEQQLAVIMDFLTYFSALNQDRRAHPTDDLATVIATAELDGAPIEDIATLGYYLLIATAGHDTTSSAISGGLLALLQHRDQLELLQNNPELIEGAADELVRWVSPVKHFMRTATADAVVGDTKIADGDWVLLSYPSANRDEDAFVDPFCFDVTRTDAGHSLAFGFGAHYCLGTHLAKLEIRAFFRELLPRLGEIELAGEPSLMQATLVSGPKTMPVRYTIRNGV
jgi:cytochrome P450